MDWGKLFEGIILTICLIVGIVFAILKWLRNIESKESFKSKISKLIIGAVIGLTIIICGIVFGFFYKWFAIVMCIIVSLFPSLFIAQGVLWFNNIFELIDIEDKDRFQERAIYISMAIISAVLISLML